MKNLWILTLVKRGFLQEPEIFFERRSAENRKKALLKDFNPDYDEIKIFEKPISL